MLLLHLDWPPLLKVPVDAPWEASSATSWDAQTLKAWLDHITRAGRSFLVDVHLLGR